MKLIFELLPQPQNDHPDATALKLNWTIEKWMTDKRRAGSFFEHLSPSLTHEDLGLTGTGIWQLKLESNVKRKLQVFFSAETPDTNMLAEVTFRTRLRLKSPQFQLESLTQIREAIPVVDSTLWYRCGEYTDDLCWTSGQLEVELVVSFPDRHFVLHEPPVVVEQVVALVSCDEKIVKVKKSSLADHFVAFARLLCQNPATVDIVPDSDKFVFKDVDGETLQLTVDFVTGTDVDTRLSAISEKAYMAAVKYDLPELQEKCELELEKSISVQNAMERYLMAKHVGAKDLVGKVVEFVKENFVEFMRSGDLDEMRKHEEMFDLLRGKKRTAEEAGF